MSNHTEPQGQILDAAMNHFAENGYKGASISKIAQEAGVSKSLIFWYFENKEKLFQALIDRFVNSCQEKLKKSGPKGNAKDKIEGFIDVYWDFICKNLQFIRIFMNWFLHLGKEKQGKALLVQNIHQRFRDIFAEYLQEGVDAGLFHPDLDIESTTIFLTSTLEGLLLQLLIQEVDQRKMQDQFFKSLKRNIMVGLIQTHHLE